MIDLPSGLLALLIAAAGFAVPRVPRRRSASCERAGRQRRRRPRSAADVSLLVNNAGVLRYSTFTSAPDLDAARQDDGRPTTSARSRHVPPAFAQGGARRRRGWRRVASLHDMARGCRVTTCFLPGQRPLRRVRTVPPRPPGVVADQRLSRMARAPPPGHPGRRRARGLHRHRDGRAGQRAEDQPANRSPGRPSTRSRRARSRCWPTSGPGTSRPSCPATTSSSTRPSRNSGTPRSAAPADPVIKGADRFGHLHPTATGNAPGLQPRVVAWRP